MNSAVPRSRRAMAAFLLVLLGGCQTWQPTSAAPSNVISEEAPSHVRVTRTDGQVVTLKSPIFRNDSLVAAPDDPFSAPTGVARSDIRSMEVRRLSKGRTAAFVAGAVAVALGWARTARTSTGGTNPSPGPLPKGS